MPRDAHCQGGEDLSGWRSSKARVKGYCLLFPPWYGQGIPTANQVNDFVQWLPSNGKKNFLILARHIYKYWFALKEKLTKNEATLRQCFKQYGCSTNHGVTIVMKMMIF